MVFEAGFGFGGDSPSMVPAGPTDPSQRAVTPDLTEDDLARSNVDSFGDDIGRTTNWITSMFDVQAQFSPDSEEYKVLDYRIRCGQLFQQNAIDSSRPAW